MARLASFYESRPEPGSILALLEANGSGARHLANTAIRLAQQESLDGNDPEYGADVEPLPLIDYHLLSTLLNYCRPTLTSRDLKRFDYLADARGLYYKAHNDFEYFYRGLQDVYASGIILDMEKQKLELSGALNARELEWNQAARIENLEEKKKVLENLEARRKKRDKCTAWFSNMKVEFLNSEMPRLVYVGKHFFHKSHLPGRCAVLFYYHGSLKLTWVRQSHLLPFLHDRFGWPDLFQTCHTATRSLTVPISL